MEVSHFLLFEMCKATPELKKLAMESKECAKKLGEHIRKEFLKISISCLDTMHM